jgi:hypothetical protein
VRENTLAAVAHAGGCSKLIEVTPGQWVLADAVSVFRVASTDLALLPQMAAPEARLPARQESGDRTNPHVDRNSRHINELRPLSRPARPLLMRRVG